MLQDDTEAATGALRASELAARVKSCRRRCLNIIDEARPTGSYCFHSKALLSRPGGFRLQTQTCAVATARSEDALLATNEASDTAD